MADQTNQHRRRLPPSARGRAQDISRDELIIGATLKLLGEVGYNALKMSDVASQAGVSKATLYRRWTAKADLVADAVATLNPFLPPDYPGTSLRDDLLALMERASTCGDRSDVVTATMEMARSNPDLYRTLSERFTTYVRREMGSLAVRAVEEGFAALSPVELDHVSETVVAFVTHLSSPASKTIPRERLIGVVDHVLTVLITGSRQSG
ncbi:TetR/AcrR family transcriptional regulator [Paludisphaera soli]|uniref:TetR/AcrR family transcriptional regulator n=1 Tax=Paludisphaera soli TaxID=2712865 RepID=UPI0013EB8FD3|nr:TetR/AcrR family transcriptional regulator [Paludisphaera soli]